MNRTSNIYIAGHRGLVGSAIMRKLKSEGYTNIITCIHSEVDLTRQTDVEAFFENQKPEYVFLSAAKVGGIIANSTYPAEFIYNNLLIQGNVIHAAYKFDVKKLLFLGSSCIYPKFAPQPIKEDALLTGKFEPTNEPYAVAKIAGITMCQSYKRQYESNFISGMPTNLYGPYDNFDLNDSHVIPALIRKFHEAKECNNKSVVIWGTGKPLREFLFSDDLADACIFLMQNYNESEIINIGTGKDITIKDLALTVKEIVGFSGELVWDASKPDGTPRKLLDVSKIQALGWRAKTSLKDGIRKSYTWFYNNYKRDLD